MEINQLPCYESELGDIFSPFPVFNRTHSIPLCNCQFPSTFGNVGYHRTKQEGDICIHCDHYVFYGLERDITDVSETKSWGYQDDVIEAVKMAYMASGNASAVAREFGISRYTIYNWMKLLKWKLKEDDDIISRAEELFVNGLNITKISKKLNISRSTVDRWKIKYKWEK